MYPAFVLPTEPPASEDLAAQPPTSVHSPLCLWDNPSQQFTTFRTPFIASLAKVRRRSWAVTDVPTWAVRARSIAQSPAHWPVLAPVTVLTWPPLLGTDAFALQTSAPPMWLAPAVTAPRL